MTEGSGIKPLIGISAYEEEASWNQWSDRAALLPSHYVRAVEAAGGIALLVPMQALGPEDAVQVVQRLDGLVLTGGPDVDPVLYGAAAHEKTSAPRPERDAVETALCDAASAGDRPLLAICRGLQVLNVARGGTLCQHLPDILGNDSHLPAADGYGTHVVSLRSGSLLGEVLATAASAVPTHHHQAIQNLGVGLKVAASTEDGTIEAVEDPSLSFLLGVQWHPEVGDDPRLFEALVAAARRRWT
ncbi:MAG: gamma-glutamyl-gamma-aminobutyrate hydrolase family protein [Acidimicrobiales bacterium]